MDNHDNQTGTLLFGIPEMTWMDPLDPVREVMARLRPDVLFGRGLSPEQSRELFRALGDPIEPGKRCPACECHGCATCHGIGYDVAPTWLAEKNSAEQG